MFELNGQPFTRVSLSVLGPLTVTIVRNVLFGEVKHARFHLEFPQFLLPPYIERDAYHFLLILDFGDRGTTFAS